jgi:GNAT superfamily N-acetyltransferase
MNDSPSPRNIDHSKSAVAPRPNLDGLHATAKLLTETFPSSDVGRVEYLHWLYWDSPFGQVIEANLDDEMGRAGHYALAPVSLALDGLEHAGALSLNTAVHERARGNGVFVRLAKEVFDVARHRGIATVLGVANANSTPGFVRRLGFELITQLPTTILVPLPGLGHTGFESHWSEPDSNMILSEYRDLIASQSPGLTRAWSIETLTWRLAAPAARYALHCGDDLLAVTTVDRRIGINIAVLLKVFASGPVSAHTTRTLVRSICRWHRAPLALHIGLNDRLALRGLPVSSLLRPSPLNLIRRALDDADRHPRIQFFELLDFDAY